MSYTAASKRKTMLNTPHSENPGEGQKKSFMFVNLAIIYMKIYKVIYPFNG